MNRMNKYLERIFDVLQEAAEDEAVLDGKVVITQQTDDRTGKESELTYDFSKPISTRISATYTIQEDAATVQT